MTLKTTPWDSTDYLKTAEDIEAYLEAALQEDDPVFFQKALGTIARAKGVQAIADRSNMTRAGIYKALSEEGNPSFGNVLKVVNALGYRLTLAGAEEKPRTSKRSGTTSIAAKDVATKPAAPGPHRAS